MALPAFYRMPEELLVMIIDEVVTWDGRRLGPYTQVLHYTPRRGTDT